MSILALSRCVCLLLGFEHLYGEVPVVYESGQAANTKVSMIQDLKIFRKKWGSVLSGVKSFQGMVSKTLSA